MKSWDGQMVQRRPRRMTTVENFPEQIHAQITVPDQSDRKAHIPRPNQPSLDLLKKLPRTGPCWKAKAEEIQTKGNSGAEQAAVGSGVGAIWKRLRRDSR